MHVQKINNNQTNFGNRYADIALKKYVPIVGKPLINSLEAETELLSKPSGNNLFYGVIKDGKVNIVQLERSMKNGLVENVMFSEPIGNGKELSENFYNYCKFTALGK